MVEGSLATLYHRMSTATHPQHQGVFDKNWQYQHKVSFKPEYGEQLVPLYNRLSFPGMLKFDISSSSVYSPFSDRVGFSPYNTPFPGVLMRSIGAAFLRPDVLPDINHMRGLQYPILF